MKNEALVPRGNVALERPAFIKEGDVRGSENITMADIKPAALRIAQATTPETKKANAAVFIDGLREGEFFNSSTREVYGDEPMGLVIINQLGHRNIEFAPQSEGGGVVDFDVADNDPRTQFTQEVRDGKTVKVKPKATKFYDYLIIAIPEDGRHIVMTMSLKSTQLKKAVQLNTTLLQSKLPAFAHLFSVTPVAEKRGGFDIYGWRIDPQGFVDEELYNEASGLYDKFVGKKIDIAVEGEAAVDEDIPF